MFLLKCPGAANLVLQCYMQRLLDLRSMSIFWLWGVAEEGEQGKESNAMSLMLSSPEFSDKRKSKGGRLPEIVLTRLLPHFSSVPRTTVWADSLGEAIWKSYDSHFSSLNKECTLNHVFNNGFMHVDRWLHVHPYIYRLACMHGQM